MGEAIQPPDLAEHLRELEARLRILETTSRLLNSSVRDGLITVQDASGNARVQLGKLPSTGDYGLEVFAAGGVSVVYADGGGLDTPEVTIPGDFYPTGAIGSAQFDVSGSGWTQVSRVQLPRTLSQPAVRCTFGYYVDAGSTCEFNVTSDAWAMVGWFADTTSPGLTGTPGAQESLDWLHGIPLGVARPGAGFYMLNLFARVSAGAGSVHVFQPWFTFMNGSHGATSGGLWQSI